MDGAACIDSCVDSAGETIDSERSCASALPPVAAEERREGCVDAAGDTPPVATCCECTELRINAVQNMIIWKMWILLPNVVGMGYNTLPGKELETIKSRGCSRNVE